MCDLCSSTLTGPSEEESSSFVGASCVDRVLVSGSQTDVSGTLKREKDDK